MNPLHQDRLRVDPRCSPWEKSAVALKTHNRMIVMSTISSLVKNIEQRQNILPSKTINHKNIRIMSVGDQGGEVFNSPSESRLSVCSNHQTKNNKSKPIKCIHIVCKQFRNCKFRKSCSSKERGEGVSIESLIR